MTKRPFKKYKMRAEGSHDIVEFIKYVGNEFRFFKMKRVSEFDADVEFTFTTTMYMHEMLQWLSNIDDSHTMMETLMPGKYYTGERRRPDYLVQDKSGRGGYSTANYCELYEWYDSNETDWDGQKLYDFLRDSAEGDVWEDNSLKITCTRC